ncbi:MAG: 4Fe-4S binding protein [Lachnospiraceae bacterium]|nr:4Fe-4S binding protein [Lachnospiraceae bacterium]
MDRKKRMCIDRAVRALVQLFFFIMFPGLFQAAFSGVKYVAMQMSGSRRIEMVPFIVCLIILSGFTIAAGRFFCGFVCAFGSFGDAVYGISQYIQKKLKKKLPCIPDGFVVYLQKLKYIILALIIVLCFAGSYSVFASNSPWIVFSKLRALELHTGFPLAGIIVFILVIAGMCVTERFFCQFLCPMGALFALLPVIKWQYPHKRKDKCLEGCSLCARNCPVCIEPGSKERNGECIKCGKCVSGCPVMGMYIPGNMGIYNNIAVFIEAAALFVLVYIFYA